MSIKPPHLPDLKLPDLHDAEELVRSSGKRINLWLHSAIGAGTLLVLATIGAFWYGNTPQFSELVRQRVEQSITASTGGHATLGHFSWSMWHRTIIIDNLTVHGLEAPNEAPYMHVDHVEAQLRWSGFFFSSYIYLESLRIVHPSIHIMVAADGTTNQPHPPHTMNSLQQTLLDLAVSHISVEQGIAVFNTKSLPFDFAARSTTLQLHYVPAVTGLVKPGTVFDPDQDEHYTADFSSDDVHTRTYDEAQVASQMQGHFTFAKDSLNLDKFSWRTAVTQLNATIILNNFSHPQWYGTATGTVDIHQVAAITGIDGFSSGTAHLDLNAHSCTTMREANSSALHKKTAPALFTHAQPVSDQTNCTDAFILQGVLTGKNAAWKNEIVQVETADTSTRVYITPHEMDFLDMHASLSDGATGSGDMHIFNYNGPARLHGILDSKVANLPLHNVLYSLAPKQFQSVDYNTASTGNVHVEWSDRLDDADVHGTLQLRPVPNQSGVPITGTVQAAYTGLTSVINIHTLAVNTPQSSLNVSGILGVITGDPLTALHSDLSTRDLSEFDSLLHALNIPDHSKTALLHGSAEYHGTIYGPIHQINLRGHVSATNVDLLTANLIPSSHWQPSAIHLDSIAADVDVSAAAINIQQAHIVHGDGSLDFSGQLRPELVSHFVAQPRQHTTTTLQWTKNSTINLELRTSSFPIAAAITAPITGSLTAEAHLTGTLAQLNAEGHLNARNGTIGNEKYSEPYQQLSASLSAESNTWSLNKIALTLPAGKLTGDASYDPNSTHTAWHVHAANFALGRLHSIPSSTGLIGVLTLDASASGTPNAPGIQAIFTIRSLALAHQSAGTLDAELHSSGNALLYTLHSNAFGGHLAASGQTKFDHDYTTQLHAAFTSLDIAPLFQLSRYKLTGHSEFGGELSLSGPLSTPTKLTGSAILNHFHVELSGIALDAAEPLHFSMASNVLHLDLVHITGADTDIRLVGSANFTNPGTLRLHSDGSINLKFLQTFDSDLVSSGRVTFSLNASGPLLTPDYDGSVRINNAALALTDVPNGLSQINGTLAFNRDRLELRQLTAMTGGGQVSLGGSITLRGGLFADITARGKDNRIRYPQGVSSSADTDLRLQGSLDNALISGSIYLTRFGLNQEFDLASLAQASNGVSAPPDPNATSSHLRLDVHITSAPQLDFQNSFAKLAGDVDLNVRGTVSSPSVLGRINISEGSASFAGTHYQLQNGNITFTNPVHIEPLLNLDATARVRDYDIYIALHGPLTNMQPNYRSEPPLPQSDILALLALGRTQEQAQIYQQQQEQGGADTTDNTLLGGALNQTVSNRAQRLFGVGSVKLDPTFVGTLGNSSARVTVEQSVARDVTVTYATNVNQTAEQLIQITWDITRSVSLVSQRDENGVFSMTFKIRQRRR